jgi:septal ring factor EnvC (AmiA/AmiB activator)
MRGFGNLLIVDHGGGFMSLYGNAETLYKQVGENVQTGESVAAVGNSGGIPQSGLYFELRYQSRPVNPSNWLAHG